MNERVFHSRESGVSGGMSSQRYGMSSQRYVKPLVCQAKVFNSHLTPHPSSQVRAERRSEKETTKRRQSVWCYCTLMWRVYTYLLHSLAPPLPRSTTLSLLHSLAPPLFNPINAISVSAPACLCVCTFLPVCLHIPVCTFLSCLHLPLLAARKSAGG